MEAYYAYVPEQDLGVAVMVNSIIALPQALVAWIIDRDSGTGQIGRITLGASVRKDQQAAARLADMEQAAANYKAQHPQENLDNYAGHYRHPLLGELRLQVSQQQLLFSLGQRYHGELLRLDQARFFTRVTSQRYSRLLLTGFAEFESDRQARCAPCSWPEKPFKNSSPQQRNHDETSSYKQRLQQWQKTVLRLLPNRICSPQSPARCWQCPCATASSCTPNSSPRRGRTAMPGDTGSLALSLQPTLRHDKLAIPRYQAAGYAVAFQLTRSRGSSRPLSSLQR